MNKTLSDTILSHFQEVLKESLSSNEESKKYGNPPMTMRVVQHDLYRNKKDKFGIGKKLNCWMVSETKIQQLENCEAVNSKQINGMYFDVADGYFSISPDSKHVLFEWFMGPRYGLGKRLEIDHEFNITGSERLYMA